MKQIATVVLMALMVVSTVLAATAPLPTTLDPGDRAQFDQILEPVFKIYNLVKYVSTAIAGIFLLYAGIVYMGSGSDPRKRDQAKNIAMYVVYGLLIIWAAPFIVGLLV